MRIVVVGAGIAGLAAAHELAARGADVTVLEASSVVGGKLQQAEVGGIVVDVGAEAMLARRREGVVLAESVGLADDIVHPATSSSMLWNRGRLVPLPRTFMGIPGDIKALDEVLSRTGRVRASMETHLLETSLMDGDVSLGYLVEERLGKEVVDRLVEPLLGGVYAGHAREISTQAAVPQLLPLLEREGSLTKAAAAALAQPTQGPVFAGIVGGIGRLAQVLAARLAVTTSRPVEAVEPRAQGWVVRVAGEVIETDGVVLATPAMATARLLREVAPMAARELDRIDYASMAIVTLAFSRHDFPPMEGSGFLVPAVDGHHIKAATFSHRKWKWVADAGEDRDLVVMRCSLGRHRDDALEHNDDDLVALALADLRQAMGLSTRPVDVHVQRWVQALPQYMVGHLGRVGVIEADVARLVGLEVCGAAYHGVGIPACIASASGAVARIMGDLATIET